MAQSVLLPTTSLPFYSPNSPDPTPLRLIAFSVAEAALQPDPYSPSFTQVSKMDKAVTAAAAAIAPDTWARPQEKPRPSSLWQIVDKAKQRGRRARSLYFNDDTSSSLPLSTPVSPASYNFVLPANSSLAASIAINTSSPQHLYTRSAAPSPTKSVFSHLDQTVPPPEFVPRLSAAEFADAAARPNKPTHVRTRSHIERQVPKPRLPSLAQIQAKMSRTSLGGDDSTASGSGSVVKPTKSRHHKRNSSVDSRPMIQSRSNSEDSIDLVTPTDEVMSPFDALRSALIRRASPPPVNPVKESKLAPFLRERTSGRLARPFSMPPLDNPRLTITPPKVPLTSQVDTLVATSTTTTPTRSTFGMNNITMKQTPSTPSSNLAVSTPKGNHPSPTSPTSSHRSFKSTTSSPTLPIITCTPAPHTVVRNGIESDEESDDVIVFAGEEEVEQYEVEREMRSRFMRDRLMLRRSE